MEHLKNDIILSSESLEGKHDVEVIFNDIRIHFHSIILSDRSQYFNMNLYSTPLVPRSISLENFDSKIAKNIIESFYTREVGLYRDSILKIAEMAIVFKAPFHIEDAVNYENCLQLLVLANKFEMKDWYDSIHECLLNNFKRVLRLDSFLKLDLIDLKNVLKSIIDTCLDVEMHNIITEWINYNPGERFENLGKLFEFVYPESTIDMSVKANEIMCKKDGTCFLTFKNDFLLPGKKCTGTNEKTLIILGGYSHEQSKFVEAYDKKLKIWKKRDGQIEKCNFCSVYHKNKLYIIGGTRNDSDLAEVECYDPKSRVKKTLSPMNDNRHFFTAVVVNNSIFAIGGRTTLSGLSLSVERYNIRTNTWELVKPMSVGRYKHGVAVLKGNIYVVGGISRGNTILNTMECFDVSTGSWSAKAPLQTNRYATGVAALNNFIYAVGGNNGGKSLSTVEKYDPTVNQWTFVQDISSPRYAVAAVQFYGSLIISGGYSDKYVATAEQYDPEKNVWSSFPAINVPRDSHSMLVVPKNIFY